MECKRCEGRGRVLKSEEWVFMGLRKEAKIRETYKECPECEGSGEVQEETEE